MKGKKPPLSPNDPWVGRVLRAACRTCKHSILSHLPEKRSDDKPAEDDDRCRCSEKGCPCIVRWKYVLDSLQGA